MIKVIDPVCGMDIDTKTAADVAVSVRFDPLDAQIIVQVTDRGEPLWIVQPAVNGHDEEERLRATNEILDEVLREPKSRFSLSRIIKESRR